MIYILIFVPLGTSLVVLYVGNSFFRPRATSLKLHQFYENKLKKENSIDEEERYKELVTYYLAKEAEKKLGAAIKIRIRVIRQILKQQRGFEEPPRIEQLEEQMDIFIKTAKDQTTFFRKIRVLKYMRDWMKLEFNSYNSKNEIRKVSKIYRNMLDIL